MALLLQIVYLLCFFIIQLKGFQLKVSLICNQPEEYENILDWINVIFSILFFCEIALKVIVYKKYCLILSLYWRFETVIF